MENKGGLEREISIGEIVWKLLFGWRKIVCLALVFSFLLGGFRYFRDMGTYRSARESEYVPEEELTNSELEEVNNIRNLQKQLEGEREYLEHSALMQMDPYSVPILELQFGIKSDYVMNYNEDILPDYTLMLGSMYHRYVSSGELRKALRERAGLSVSSEELEELIDAGQNSNIVAISVKYPDREKLEDISAALKELLSQKEKEYQQIGSHQLMLLGESQDAVIDDRILEKRNEMTARAASISVQINSLKNVLSEQQKSVLEHQVNEEKGLETVLEKPQLNKIYFILGGCVGIFLAGIWILCSVLFTAKLQHPEELRTLFQVRLLGEIKTQNKRRRFLSAIDDKLLLFKNRKKKKLSEEQQMDIACMNVAISCKKCGVKELYMTGSEYEHLDDTVKKRLKEELKRHGIQVIEGENMYYNAHSMEQGMEVGNILLVEQVEQSVYDEIFNEVQLLAEQSVNILGAIVVE